MRFSEKKMGLKKAWNKSWQILTFTFFWSVFHNFSICFLVLGCSGSCCGVLCRGGDQRAWLSWSWCASNWSWSWNWCACPSWPWGIAAVEELTTVVAEKATLVAIPATPRKSSTWVLLLKSGVARCIMWHILRLILLWHILRLDEMLLMLLKCAASLLLLKCAASLLLLLCSVAQPRAPWLKLTKYSTF